MSYALYARRQEALDELVEACTLAGFSPLRAFVDQRLESPVGKRRWTLSGLVDLLEAAAAGQVHSVVVYDEESLRHPEVDFDPQAELERCGAAVRRREVPKAAAAKRRMATRGQHFSRAPFGYRREQARLIPDEDQAAEVRRIFGLYLATGSLEETREAAQRAGGRRWSKGALAILLKNRTYLGLVKLKEDEWRGQHPPLVSRSTFGVVQRRLATNKGGRPCRRQAKSSATSWRSSSSRPSRPRTTAGTETRRCFVSSASA